jgi:hypothetical protein
MSDVETVRRLALVAAIGEGELAEVLEDSWRRKAPKRLIAQRDASAGASAPDA